MELLELVSHESLITEISGEIVDFAAFLEIPCDIRNIDNHIYISEADLSLRLSSYYTRRNTDVMVSAEVFCDVLMDIKAGLPTLEAFNKQGYTF